MNTFKRKAGSAGLAVALGLMMGIATQADAAIITFTDRTAFQSGATNLVTSTFETAPPNGFTSYGPAGYTENGTKFTGKKGNGGGFLFTVDSGYDDPDDVGKPFSLGSGDVLHGNRTLLALLAPNTTALGFDFGSLFNPALFSFTTTNTSGATQTFSRDAFDNIDPSFFGLYSDIALASIEINTNNNSEFSNIDNFSTGQVAAVPEPGTMSLMGLGLAALAAARRKKKAAQEETEEI